MAQQWLPEALIYHGNSPIIDQEFDRFELCSDLKASLREAEAATFYHDALELHE